VNPKPSPALIFESVTGKPVLTVGGSISLVILFVLISRVIKGIVYDEFNNFANVYSMDNPKERIFVLKLLSRRGEIKLSEPA
jgi:hypothetical protein